MSLQSVGPALAPGATPHAGRLMGALMLALIIILSAPLVATAQAPDGGGGDASLEGPGLQAFAAGEIAEELAISEREAHRRLELQDQTAGAVERIRSLMGPEYSGAWYDHDQEGRLKIGLPFDADPSVAERVREALAADGVERWVDLVGVRWRWSQLVEAQRTLDGRLAGLIRAGKVVTMLNPSEANAVIVQTARSITPDEQARVEESRARSAVAVSVQRSAREVFSDAPASCGPTGNNYYYCSNPLRGGPRIFGPTGCTAGFMTRGSGAGNLPYVLTAGHCLAAGSGGWSTRGHPGFAQHAIGPRWSYTYPGSDYGIIRVTNSIWNPGPYIFIDGSPDTPNPNNRYRINTGGYSSLGMTVCASSGIRLSHGYFTDCGTVTAVNYTATYGVFGLGRASLCIVGGASGGPVFKANRAYGITSGRGAGCVGYYQHVPEALSQSNVHLQP